MKLAITSVIALIILVTIQVLLPANLFLGGKIDFAIILIVYVGLVSGKSPALLYAFFAGLLIDSFNPVLFGIHAFSYTLIAFIVTLFHKKVQLNNILTMMLMPLIATIGKALTLLIIMVLVKALTGEGNISLDKFLISSFAELLMNTIFAPLIYLILNLIVKKDRKSYL
jgi:rod shape-determining protein MreD